MKVMLSTEWLGSVRELSVVLLRFAGNIMESVASLSARDKVDRLLPASRSALILDCSKAWFSIFGYRLGKVEQQLRYKSRR